MDRMLSVLEHGVLPPDELATVAADTRRGAPDLVAEFGVSPPQPEYSALFIVCVLFSVGTIAALTLGWFWKRRHDRRTRL